MVKNIGEKLKIWKIIALFILFPGFAFGQLGHTLPMNGINLFVTGDFSFVLSVCEPNPNQAVVDYEIWWGKNTWYAPSNGVVLNQKFRTGLPDTKFPIVFMPDERDKIGGWQLFFAIKAIDVSGNVGGFSDTLTVGRPFYVDLFPEKKDTSEVNSGDQVKFDELYRQSYGKKFIWHSIPSNDKFIHFEVK